MSVTEVHWKSQRPKAALYGLQALLLRDVKKGRKVAPWMLYSSARHDISKSLNLHSISFCRPQIKRGLKSLHVQ